MKEIVKLDVKINNISYEGYIAKWILYADSLRIFFKEEMR